MLKQEEQFLRSSLKDKPLSQDVDVKELVDESVTFSGAEIAEVCREGIWEAIREADFEAEKVKITMLYLRQAVVALKKN